MGEQRRAASEVAILDTARARVAAVGPDGVSLRDVAGGAGCSHTLVGRYFGSKDELVAAVGQAWATEVASAVDEVLASSADPLLDLLALAGDDRQCVQLLVRAGLGDMEPPDFPDALRVDHLGSAVRSVSGGDGGRGGRRSRLCAYAAASLLLGWITFRDFVVSATRLAPVGAPRQDRAIADGARRLLALADAAVPALHPRPPEPEVANQRPSPEPSSAKDALLAASIELFAERGPASVSVRDVARRAGVNQGLIYRHFGSKAALLAEAIDQGSAILVPAAWASPTFDFDAMSHLMHHESPAPRLIARALVDDLEISQVRDRFPVLRGLLGTFDDVPTGPGPGDLTDPRVAVAVAATMALGSVIWGPHLRGALGLSDDDGIESAMADLARTITTWPRGPLPAPEVER